MSKPCIRSRFLEPWLPEPLQLYVKSYEPVCENWLHESEAALVVTVGLGVVGFMAMPKARCLAAT